MSSQINTIPIQQFIQQVKAAELSQQKEIKLDIKSAKNLAFCIGEVSAKLLEDYDRLLNELKESQGSGNINIKMDGGGFSNN
jgi:deoxyadenosine/deoxycytidine kinase